MMEYKMKSPLIPPEGGYPILGKRRLETPDGHYAEIDVQPEELEVEYMPIKKGSRTVLVPVVNPYLMKGAVKYLRAKNATEEAELDEMAEQLASNK